MSNKLKSLIYLSCFVLAAIVYNMAATENSIITFSDTKELAEADIVIQPFIENFDQTQTK